TVKLTYCPVPASMPAAREIWDCASGLGTLVAVMVAFMNQPGSTPPDPGRIRKSFRTYWFSLKTPLRDGRSATQPEPAHSDARAPVTMNARMRLPFMTRVLLESSHALLRDGLVHRVEERRVEHAAQAEARVDGDGHAVGERRDEVRVVVEGAVPDDD